MKFNTIAIFCANTTERKQEICEIHEFSARKEMKFMRVDYNSETTLSMSMKKN